MKWVSNYLYRSWYGSSTSGVFLAPLGVLYSFLRSARNLLYDCGILKEHHFPVPVIVVGNITAGGAGKTPLVITLANELRNRGYHPGVVSRGYGASGPYPAAVEPTSDPGMVGDEAVLTARRTGVPMVVDPDRVNAVATLLKSQTIDVVLSDDGLQHRRLGRYLEVAVIDGEREFGNRKLVPAGPLRDPVTRLKTVDLIVRNGGAPQNDEFAMTCLLGDAVNVLTGERRNLESFSDSEVKAVAGVGNPGRFFRNLRSAGLRIETYVFPDHHVYTEKDLRHYSNQTVLMTEKDALKCEKFAGKEWWWVDLCVEFDNEFTRQIVRTLEGFRSDES